MNRSSSARLGVHWITILFLPLLLPGATAYPDPNDAPGRFASPCSASQQRHFVFDYVGALTTEDAQATESALCGLYASTGIHCVVAAVADTGGETLEAYALHLFEAWGIGDRDRLDGVLLLGVSPEAQELVGRIEVGYGLEDQLNAAQAQRILDDASAARQAALEANATPEHARSIALRTAADLIQAHLAAQSAETGPAGRPLALDPAALAATLLGLSVIVGTAYLYRNAFRGPRNQWGDVDHTRLDYFLAGALWRRDPTLDPGPGSRGYPWYERGKRFRYVGLILYGILLFFGAARRGAWTRPGGRFGGGRSGGGGASGKL